jgi:hypothetical protein
MAASPSATANSPLRHLMTSNPRITFLPPTNITVRAVQRRMPANLRLFAHDRNVVQPSQTKPSLNRPTWRPPHAKLRRGGKSRRARQPSKTRSSILARDERP